jgi:aspartate/methionine/tyrosine aminotransferase
VNFGVRKKLREAIARRYKAIEPENIVEVSPEEGVFITLNTMLSPGDEVIVMEPIMPSLHEIPRAIGCEVIPWPLNPTEWGWKIDTDFLKNTISSKTKLLILSLPNNPTGCMPPIGELQRIAQIADSVGCWIFNEESLRGMEHDPGATTPRMADIYDRAVSLGSMCRNGLAAVGLGWLATQNKKLVSDLLAYKDYISPCTNPMSEVLGLIYFRNIQTITLRNKKIIEHNLHLAEGYFKSQPGVFEWTPPDAGSTAFPKLDAAYDSNDLCAHAVEDAGIMMVPDRMYSVNMNRYRIGYGRNDFGLSLVKFSDFVDRYKEKKR